ncbi:MAG: hypothetical protein L3J41_08305 [Melioribacteraceae bacterium]|nr:hypothetical protein [Melioribacteraceae bacterium]
MLKLKIKFVFLLLLLLSSTKSSFSQTNIHSVGFDVGYIGSVDQYSDLVIFPEIFMGGDFITSNFNWKANIGYWDDGTNAPKYIQSPSTYAYSSFVIGAELLFLFPVTNLYRPSPVRILSGLSYHYVSVKEFIGPMPLYNYSNNYPKNLTGNLFYLNVGMEIHILIQKSFTVFLKGIGYYLLNNREVFKDNRWRLQLSLGLNYNFKL